MSTNPGNPLDDAMPGRKIIARWVICGALKLETAMHLGGSEGTERVDAPVLRDTRCGAPLLPGTTLAGALRNALSERLPVSVALLFGGARGDNDGSQSPLIVFDAFGKLATRSEAPPGEEKEYGIEIRDGVAISPDTGTAEDHKKYDYEVLPAGTTFPVRLELLVAEEAEEKRLLEALAAALDAFSHGENGFGAKRSRGLGRVSATWSAERFALTNQDEWMRWLETDHANPIGARSPASTIRAALEEIMPRDLQPLSLPDEPRKHIVIELELEVAHDILIRSSNTEAGAPDVSHLTSGGQPILSGTSLAGVMRAQALRIADLVHNSQAEAAEWIQRLFGPRFEGKHPPPGDKPRASRLRISEGRLTRSNPQKQTRVAIDRFTQGAVDGALFDEQTQVGGHAHVRLELRTPQEGEPGLVLLVVKDLLSGRLPVGGTSSIGRGVVNGTATVKFHDAAGNAPRSVKLEPGKPPIGDGAEQITKWIEQFHRAPALERTTSQVPGKGGAS